MGTSRLILTRERLLERHPAANTKHSERRASNMVRRQRIAGVTVAAAPTVTRFGRRGRNTRTLTQRSISPCRAAPADEATQVDRQPPLGRPRLTCALTRIAISAHTQCMGYGSWGTHGWIVASDRCGIAEQGLEAWCWSLSYILTRRRGAPTRHTHKWDTAYIYQLLHTRHLLESTHTNTYISSWLEVSLRTFARPRGPP